MRHGRLRWWSGASRCDPDIGGGPVAARPANPAPALFAGCAPAIASDSSLETTTRRFRLAVLVCDRHHVADGGGGMRENMLAGRVRPGMAEA